MKRIYLFYVLIVCAVMAASISCKESSHGNAISTLSPADSGSGTGCRGRNSGIKNGLSSLNLPYPNGTAYTVSQTWNGPYSHYRVGSEHAVDFPMNRGDNVLAVQQGRVMAVKEDSNINCSSNCPHTNYALIDHGGGYYGKYYHFKQNGVTVNVGDLIGNTATQIIGHAGNTGWSTEPHLHFELVDWEENCTVKYGFVENSSSLTPLTVGQSYTSTNTVGASYSPSFISGGVYKNVGILLTNTVSWYRDTSAINIQGNLTSEATSDGYNQVAVFLLDSNMRNVSTPSYFTTGGTFNINYTLPSVSYSVTYYLCVSKSKSANNSYWWDNPPIMVFHI
jgi:murein DD-endopeptidase MepM/ murein hydrolase activator NlpD